MIISSVHKAAKIDRLCTETAIMAGWAAGGRRPGGLLGVAGWGRLGWAAGGLR